MVIAIDGALKARGCGTNRRPTSRKFDVGSHLEKHAFVLLAAGNVLGKLRQISSGLQQIWLFLCTLARKITGLLFNGNGERVSMRMKIRATNIIHRRPRRIAALHGDNSAIAHGNALGALICCIANGCAHLEVLVRSGRNNHNRLGTRRKRQRISSGFRVKRFVKRTITERNRFHRGIIVIPRTTVVHTAILAEEDMNLIVCGQAAFGNGKLAKTAIRKPIV